MYRIIFVQKDSQSVLIFHQVWCKLRDENLVETLFFDGTCKNFSDFMDIMTRKNTLPFALFKDDEIYGFFWLNNFAGKTAQIHFTAFKNSIGLRRCAPSFGTKCISYALSLKDELGYFIDTILGVTPISYKLALKFNKRAGMKEIGRIPNRCVMYYKRRVEDALLTYATRETLEIHKDQVAAWEE